MKIMVKLMILKMGTNGLIFLEKFIYTPTLVRKSYVALDLGGGSTQITFTPKYDETFQDTPSHFLHQVSVIRYIQEPYILAKYT